MSEPVQNSDGKYIADGGRTFDTRGEAQRWNAAYGNSSSGSSVCAYCGAQLHGTNICTCGKGRRTR